MFLYIPKVESCDWYEINKGSYHDIKEYVKKPSTKYFTKDDVPLWAFYKPISNPKLGYWNRPKFYTENFEYCYALLLDFDNDGNTEYISIADAISIFSDFEYCLYTSFRHTPLHHKFRMIIPLNRPLNHRAFRYDGVKQWFLNRFPSVDVSASIKTLQKHKIPAHHPFDLNYKYHINEAPRLDLPLERFNELIEKEIEEEKKRAVKLVKSHTHQSILDMPIEEIDAHNYTINLESKYRNELENFNWNRGSGNNVHGNLLRMAYAMQQAGIDYMGIITEYAPHEYYNEIKRMKI